MEISCTFCGTDCVFVNNAKLKNIDEIQRYDASFNVGETIVKEYTPQDYIVFVKTGIVKLVVHTPHHDVIFSVTNRYSGFPCKNFKKHQKAEYSIIALTPVEICLFSIFDFKKIAEIDSSFNFKLLNSSQYFLNCLIEILKVRSSKNLAGRLAQKIIYFSNNLFQATEFEIPLNRQELADFAGGSKEAVIRELHKLKESGLIEFRGRYFRILNLEGLKKIYSIS